MSPMIVHSVTEANPNIVELMLIDAGTIQSVSNYPLKLPANKIVRKIQFRPDTNQSPVLVEDTIEKLENLIRSAR